MINQVAHPITGIAATATLGLAAIASAEDVRTSYVDDTTAKWAEACSRVAAETTFKIPVASRSVDEKKAFCLYMSPKNAVLTENGIIVWFRMEWCWPQRDTVSSIERDEFDCVTSRMRTHDYMAYSLRNLTGDVVASQSGAPSEESWQGVPPDTLSDSMMTAACTLRVALKERR